ncbi:MAG: hypothetical protein WBG39_10930 [Gordonia sp. (in: high G+C Gram-positive bacteria)]
MTQQQLHAPAGLAQAVTVARKAAAQVPAYRALLAVHHADGERIDSSSFAALPQMTKGNYLTAHSPAQRLRHGEPTVAATWSASSGSSGMPTFWPRDEQATADSVEFFDRIFSEHFRSLDERVLLVNAFAMGQWVGGIYTHEGVRGLRELGHQISVATPGMNIDAVLAWLSGVGDQYDSVVLAGYPPFVKQVLQESPPALRKGIKILLAGETITEAWRDSVHRLVGADTELQSCLLYGTADAGVMGFESRLTQTIRRLAVIGSPLADDLYGPAVSVAPTFVEYDPYRRYVEVDTSDGGDGYLLFTIDGAAPLVRYRINDTGRILDAGALAEILRANGFDELAGAVPPHAAYLVLFGRTDVAATFYSANIYPQPLHAVFDDVALAQRVSGRFVITSTDGADAAPQLVVGVELAIGADPDECLRTHLVQACSAALANGNSEYRSLLDTHGPAALPVIEFCDYGAFAAGDAQVKHRWVGGAR